MTTQNDNIIFLYKGNIKTYKDKIIEFTCNNNLDTLYIDNNSYPLNKNSKKYKHFKFRNNIMENIHTIIINKEYKLKRFRNIKNIYCNWDIDNSWYKLNVIKLTIDDNFIKRNFNKTVYKCYTKLNKIYKDKFYVWCYIYINGGFYVGNKFLKLNYPIEFFIKRMNVIVYNNIKDQIYEDFFYFNPNNKFLFAIISTIAMFVTNNRYMSNYDILFGGKLFSEIYNSKKIFSESIQILKFNSFIKTDLDRYCQYCWINNGKSYDRYIDITVNNYREVEKLNNFDWKLKKIFNLII